MKFVFLLMVLCGCTAQHELLDLTVMKKNCEQFQQDFLALGPIKEVPSKIGAEIADCQKYGFWK